MNLQLINTDLLKNYISLVPLDLNTLIDNLCNKKTALTKDSFDFYTSIASVYSSKIEGEDIELDSYLKHKYLGINYLPDYTKRTDDLAIAYKFASTHPLNKNNLLIVHQLITKNILIEGKRGTIRTSQMFVTDKQGNINYVAADAAIVNTEMDKWFSDVTILSAKVLENYEALFYASMLHLTFVDIHPFNDGNGRTGRLIEKWFLADYFGVNAWNIESERYYYENRQQYYTCLNNLGLEYATLDFSKAIPFTQLLINSLQL